MKTPEEIMTGMRKCHSEENCDGCPYLSEEAFCERRLEEDALQYMEQLEKRCKEQEERIRLMIIQMRGDCGCCAHKGRPSHKSLCTVCLSEESRPMWKYEGLPEVNHEKDQNRLG
ncbi:MAG: hypothetical protein ACI4PG_06480 [Candidatus Ventricola sp.]